MNRKERTEILVHSELSFLKELAQKVTSQYPVTLLEPPQGGLVMIRMRDSALKQQFFLGEVYVNECKVTLSETVGLGIASGVCDETVYALAVIDAAFNCQVPLVGELASCIADQGKQQLSLQLKRTQQLLKTQVSFETLDEEVKS